MLPAGIKARIAVEAGSSFGWCRDVGPEGAVIAVDRFGASAPGSVMMRQFGFTVAEVCKRAGEVIHALKRSGE